MALVSGHRFLALNCHNSANDFDEEVLLSLSEMLDHAFQNEGEPMVEAESS